MRAVLLIAHGSRKAEATDEIFELTRKLSTILADHYDEVSCAFLERATPHAPEKIQEMLNSGITDLTIIPYLLATGRHVAVDIPGMVSTFKQRYPDITIRVIPHIGTSTEMPGLIQRHMADSARKKGVKNKGVK